MATYFEELNTLERYVKTLRKSDADTCTAAQSPPRDLVWPALGGPSSRAEVLRNISSGCIVNASLPHFRYLLSNKPLMVAPLTEISGACSSNAGQKRKAIKILEELEDIIF
ncbi:hypothetical protein GGX14DRAFT_397520 [Mycena pura]|uniref:Uncharacterized protein n=1 Tax=Mycena pura TaxID=153505 RepID=A0AAD6Y8S3_9AGAR|nr:hypothetical protein GGX14DRAFT_397520 [Mycena pura]